MFRKLWQPSQWHDKDDNNSTDDQELQDVEIRSATRDISRSRETMTDVIHHDTDIPPAFTAIQQSDISALENYLADENFDINSKCCGLTLLHIACHTKKLHILQTILRHMPLVNLLDSAGNTALHIAVAEGWHNGVKELLQHGASIDIKSKRQENSVKKETDETPLHLAIRRGDASSTTLILEQKPDLFIRDSNHCTVLHLAAKSLKSHILERLLTEKPCQELLETKDKKGNSIMHAAVPKEARGTDESSVLKVIRILFEEGVDVSSVNDMNESPIFLAACAGLPETVSFLLSLGADKRVLTSTNQSLLHGACQSGSAECLNHLLNTKSLIDYIIMRDSDGREPFYYAVQSSSIDCCELLLNNGDYLSRRDKNGITRCSLILDCLPSAPKLLEKMFDKGISFSDKPQYDPDFYINFEYSSLLSSIEDLRSSFQGSIISVLNSYSESEALLKHPLVESFLFKKWNRIKLLFYANVLTFFTFIIFHSWYIVSIYKTDPMAVSMKLINIYSFRFLHILMYLLLVIPEVIITLSNPKKILRHWETHTKFISLISSAFVIFSPVNMEKKEIDSQTSFNVTINDTLAEERNLTYSQIINSNQNMSFQRHMAAVSAFFGWVELMMLLGRFPPLGVYTLMFTRIAKSMLRFIIAFITLLIGFSLSFLVLFHSNDSFSSVGHSIVKVLMMMAGDISYDDLVDKNTPVISYVLLVAFVFLVSILMINLLIGVAVNDISNLEYLGKLQRLSKQASFLVSLENLIWFLRNLRFFPRSMLIPFENMLKIKPVTCISLNRARFKMCGNSKLPAEVIEAALDIKKSNQVNTTKKDHDTKEEQTHKTLMQILNILETLQPQLDSVGQQQQALS